MIPTRLRDPVLKISPDLYTFCVGLRVFLAWMVWSVVFPSKRETTIIIALMIVGFFVYKLWVNPTSWKNYRRTIIIWSAIVWIAWSAGGWERWVALLILIDVLMGQQSWYIAKYYLK